MGSTRSIIQLDTPGGLDVSMREIIQEILDSEVPVVVWVAPRGARAASAGTFITYAANLAYMAEATELGAATPDRPRRRARPLERRSTNDAAAYIRSLAQRTTAMRSSPRPRCATRARSASDGGGRAGRRSTASRRRSASCFRAWTAQTVEHGCSATSLSRPGTRPTNAPSVIYPVPGHERDAAAAARGHEPGDRLPAASLGLFGIIFELYNPGIGLAGILGAVSSPARLLRAHRSCRRTGSGCC